MERDPSGLMGTEKGRGIAILDTVIYNSRGKNELVVFSVYIFMRYNNLKGNYFTSGILAMTFKDL